MTTTASVRSLPPRLAAVVEQLELDGATLVTAAELDQMRIEVGIATPVNVLAARLRQHGWLLPTPRRGVYEFAPGARAGAFSRGDATLPLQAVLRARPDLNVGLALQSAAWAWGMADRAPSRMEIAAADRSTARSVESVLKDQARVVVFDPQLPWEFRRGAPTMAVDSVLVHMAARPADVRSWTSALEWLPDLAAEATTTGVGLELATRPASVANRLSYLLAGLRPDISDQVVVPGRGVVYFGARGRSIRHDPSRGIVDTLLPADPRDLEPVEIATTISSRRNGSTTSSDMQAG